MDESKSVPTGEAARSTTTAPTKNIVETVINAGDFTTFAAAINAAGLTAELGGKGPFTVFAPAYANPKRGSEFGCCARSAAQVCLQGARYIQMLC